jgi:hypothetical protein
MSIYKQRRSKLFEQLKENSIAIIFSGVSKLAN